MPGLGAALRHIRGVQATGDSSNQVQRFSYSLINTLTKEHAAERARTPLARSLQQKQQRHMVLLECLAAADAFAASPGSPVRSLVPAAWFSNCERQGVLDCSCWPKQNS
jgi:hypothetical protein